MFSQSTDSATCYRKEVQSIALRERCLLLCQISCVPTTRGYKRITHPLLSVTEIQGPIFKNTQSLHSCTPLTHEWIKYLGCAPYWRGYRVENIVFRQSTFIDDVVERCLLNTCCHFVMDYSIKQQPPNRAQITWKSIACGMCCDIWRGSKSSPSSESHFSVETLVKNEGHFVVH